MTYVCSNLIAGVAGSNPAECMDALSLGFVVCIVGSGLCYEVVIHLEEPYRQSLCVCVCVCFFVI